MEKQKLRDEVSNDYKWDLTKIYKTDEEWNKDYQKLESEIIKIKDYTNFIESSENLYNFLTFNEKLERLLNKLYYYAHLNFDVDTLNDKYQEMNQKMIDMLDYFNELTSFVIPTFLKVDYDKVQQYINELPSLKEYEFKFSLISFIKLSIINPTSYSGFSKDIFPIFPPLNSSKIIPAILL